MMTQALSSTSESQSPVMAFVRWTARRRAFLVLEVGTARASCTRTTSAARKSMLAVSAVGRGGVCCIVLALMKMRCLGRIRQQKKGKRRF